MARINYKLDKELATSGLLRISVVAKALKLAPKTVNAWTKYSITKIGGVKYLTWLDVFTDKQPECALFSLTDSATLVHDLVTNTKLPVVTKVQSALDRAKSLLVKKLPPPAVQETLPETKDKEEILAPVVNEESILTIPPEYQHFIRKI